MAAITAAVASASASAVSTPGGGAARAGIVARRSGFDFCRSLRTASAAGSVPSRGVYGRA